MPHVADWKKEKVAELEELTNNNEIIGIVNLADIPAPQLQTMRRTLGDQAILKMSRKNFIKIALDNVDKENIEGLEDYVDISYSDFDIHYYNDVCYYSLSLSHYLHIFQTRYEDDKNQNDYNMIEFIQSYINKVDTTYFISDYFKGFLNVYLILLLFLFRCFGALER